MGHKLLLADDSVTIQRVIELTFSGEDVQVLAVGDGEQAIACIPAEHPDIVLADIGMPKRSGYEVAAFIKGNPDTRHIPVLLLAGAFEPVDEARAQEVGCNGVLVKPFEPQQVIARVRELLEGTRSTLAPIVPGEVRPDERPAPPVARTIEFPKPAAPKPPPAAERREPVAPPVVEQFVAPPPVEPFVPAETPAMGPDESLDDYFDRLDAAFATLETSSVGNPVETTRDEVSPDEGLSIPTLDDLLRNSGFDEPAADLPLNAVAADRTDVVADRADAVPLPEMPPSPRPVPAAPAAPATAQPATRSVIADAFTSLLAVEQGEPGARPVRLTSGAAEPVITDELIDEVSRRVLARLGPDAVRDVVRDIVSEIAERLVREEIERIRRTNG